MIKVKVCGLRHYENIKDVALLKPDYMGFIFYKLSKRYVGDNFEMPLIESEIKKVGVFVNESEESILRIVKKNNLDLVQLHGDESAEFCIDLRMKSIQIIKAFAVDEHFDFDILKLYESSCDYFLFDTKSKEYGGSGVKFDKKLLDKNKINKPFFLSGGLDIEDVNKQQTAISNLYSFDVNSKFETKPGFKDINKLKQLKNELSGRQ